MARTPGEYTARSGSARRSSSSRATPERPAAAQPAAARRPGLPGRSNETPRSRSDTNAACPITTWSSRSMSSRRPAASASAVRCRSSGLGVGSPLGWLWTRMTPAAFVRTASRIELAHADEGGGDVALVDGHHLEDDVLRVQEDHPQLLALVGTHLDHQALRHVPRGPDGPSAGRPGLGRAAAQLECRGQLGRLRRPDPRQATKLQLARPGETGKPVVAGERLFRQAQGADTARPGAPDERHELRGREARGASSGEPFAGAFVGRHLAQAPAAGGNGRSGGTGSDHSGLLWSVRWWRCLSVGPHPGLIATSPGHYPAISERHVGAIPWRRATPPAGTGRAGSRCRRHAGRSVRRASAGAGTPSRAGARPGCGRRR